ncbi:MAG TPA: ABC transporter permease subunit [Spirochaetia bacterium]|nr:ABC transporter permease subunit [Spirochaetia bacterium]
MKWSRIRAIAQKDIREISTNRMVVLPMVVVPLILCVVLPAGITLLALKLGVAAVQGAPFIEKIVPFYPVPAELAGTVDSIVYIFLNYTFLPFFMVVPIVVSTVIAANAVVGEKERKTLETLLYTPVTSRELLVAKELAVFLPAIVIAYASFIAYFLVTNGIGLALRGIMLVRSIVWIPGLLLLAPAVSLLALSVSILVSLKAKSFVEAQQTAGLVVLTVIGLVGAQITGVVIFNFPVVLAISAVLLGASYLLVERIGPRFNRERVIATM